MCRPRQPRVSRDELGDLRAKIDDEDLVVLDERLGASAGREGGIEERHFDPMCGARPHR
jgi:hypothetical protein